MPTLLTKFCQVSSSIETFWNLDSSFTRCFRSLARTCFSVNSVKWLRFQEEMLLLHLFLVDGFPWDAFPPRNCPLFQIKNNKNEQIKLDLLFFLTSHISFNVFYLLCLNVTGLSSVFGQATSQLGFILTLLIVQWEGRIYLLLEYSSTSEPLPSLASTITKS